MPVDGLFTNSGYVRGMSTIAEQLPGAAAGASLLRTRRLISALVIGCILFQAFLVFAQPINWDEFRFLSDVHLLARGELEAAVQTFHAHLFRWLLWLPGHETDQVIAARLVMLALECGTAALIYRCARRFASPVAALLAVLCYLSTNEVMRHGASFRFDPPSTFLLMAALTLLTTARLRIRVTAAVGVLVALAALITIKSVFFLPTLACVSWWRLGEAVDRRGTFLNLIAGACAGACALALFYAFHVAHIAPSALESSQGIVSHSVDKTLGHARILPQGVWWLRSLLESPINWLLFLGGCGVAVRAMISARGNGRTRALALASFALPMLTLFFYRNAFPYYFAFILAPASVLAAKAAEQIGSNGRAAFIAVALFVCGAVHGVKAIVPEVSAQQRVTLDAIHLIFPEPVAYIDGYSMVGAFPKRGFFMSTWGTEVYRDADRPIMRDLLSRERPAFVLANNPMLDTALSGSGSDRRLLPEDAATLRANFVPHWGAIWVAGKRLVATEAGAQIELLVRGRYTLEAAVPVLLDGIRVAPGAVVELGGLHHVRSEAGAVTVTLRWGDRLERPREAPPQGPLFAPF